MLPGTYDLELAPGDNFGPYIFQFILNGNPIDFTGWSVFAQAVLESDDDRPCNETRIDLNPVFNNPATDGIVTLAIVKETTIKYPEGNGTWDLLLQDPSGNRYQRIVGSFVSKKPTSEP
jgi:hypothetical protein